MVSLDFEAREPELTFVLTIPPGWRSMIPSLMGGRAPGRENDENPVDGAFFKNDRINLFTPHR
jgi:hypothetical protein